jgi:hypothetical protein
MLQEKILLIKAVSGNSEARYALAMYYLDRSNFEKAHRWMIKSADSAYAPAQYGMGNLCAHGKAGEKDETAAAAWYAKAAGQEYGPAATALGRLYASGRGVERNYGEALRWLEIAVVGASSSLDGRIGLAWLLSTCPDNSIRNGKKAMNLLAHVVNLGRKEPAILDALSAAYAEVGMMESAIDHAKEALALVDRTKDPDLFTRINAHYRCYLGGLPWREPGSETQVVEENDTRGESTEIIEFSPAIESDEDASFIIEEPPVTEPLDTETVTPVAADGPHQSIESLQMEKIVEKLVIIEELLRPLKEETSPDESAEKEEKQEEPVSVAARNPEPEELNETEVESPNLAEAGDPSESEGLMAQDFSQDFVNALIQHRYEDVYAMMDSVFQEVVPRDSMEPMVHQMYETHGGEPAFAELRTSERIVSGEQKPVYRFWYDLSGKDQQKGEYSLFTEIVLIDQGYACSAFFVSPAGKAAPQEHEVITSPWFQ